MIHLFTSASGNDTEGIGAIAQCQIHTYTLSKLLGVNFIGQRFTNLQHYQEHSTQEKFCDDVTEFFNIPNIKDIGGNVIKFDRIDDTLIKYIDDNRASSEDIFVEIDKCDIMRVADSNCEIWNKFIPDLASRVKFDQSKYYFDDNKINVSLHITNFIEGRDNDRSSQREQFIPGNEKEKYYINMLQKINDIFSRVDNGTLFVEKEYHIYSRSQTPGDTSQFEIFAELGLPIKFHIDEHPLTSLYHLIKSDVKVLSNSSFSYISSLYGEGLSIARENFQHKIPSNVIYADYNGNFDDTLIRLE